MNALNVGMLSHCAGYQRPCAFNQREPAAGIHERRRDKAIAITEFENARVFRNLAEQPADEVFLAEVFYMNIRYRAVGVIVGRDLVKLFRRDVHGKRS